MKSSYFKFTLVLFCSLFLSIGCKKNVLPKKPNQSIAQTMEGHPDITISMDEIFQQLPQTIMHNIGDSLKFYVDRVQWSYKKDYLLMRIPTSEGNNSFMYVIKDYNNLDKVNLYSVQFFPTANSTDSSFSGRQMWINYQDWNVYGVRYDHGQIINYLTPVKMIDKNWEECAMAHHRFGLDANNKIVITDDTTGGGDVAMRSPLDCPHSYSGGGFWKSIGAFFQAVGSVMTDIGNDIGDWLNNIGGGDAGGSGGSAGGGWGGGDGGYGGYGGYGGNTSCDPNGSGGFGGGSTGSGTGNNNGDDGNSVPPLHNIFNPSGGTLLASAGSGYPPLHTKLPIFPGNPPINYLDGTDANGFLYSRIEELQVYLQAHPYGMLDCNDIAQLPMNMYQQVGNYQIPQSVLDRITSLRNQYAPTYNSSTFFIQKIQDAHGGVVNCDYFTVHITQLPKNASNITMTPDEFLESVRGQFTYLINKGGNSTVFTPYNDNSVNFDDSPKNLSSYENSLGALVHIEIPPAYDNGTVIESGYQRSFSTNSSWFVFSTMTSPLDAAHPVADNRRFGIFPDPNGGYCFYTMGVDRTYDLSTTIFNFVTNGGGFGQADNLWHSVQDGIIYFVNHSNGQASLYNPRDTKARPKWDGVVKEFLLGHITLQQMKAALNCP